VTTPSIGWNGSSRRAEITALSQASALDGDAAAPLSKRAVLLSFLPSVALPLFLAAVDQTITATALPAIAGQLGQVERVSWVVVSYLIAGTIAAPIYGRLGDALGRKRMMFGALAVFITASALCALSGSILALTGARLLQGLGAGGLMTLSQALIGEYIPARERGRYQGYLATVFVTAASVGPLARRLVWRGAGGCRFVRRDQCRRSCTGRDLRRADAARAGAAGANAGGAAGGGADRIGGRVPGGLSHHCLCCGDGEFAGLADSDKKDLRKRFFFEKKKQKTFTRWSLRHGRCRFVRSTREKFFGSFFQKRTSFFRFILRQTVTPMFFMCPLRFDFENRGFPWT